MVKKNALKGTSTIKVYLPVCGSTTEYLKIKLYEAFCEPRWSSMKSGKLPQVMLLEAALDGPEDYKFENKKKNLAVWSLLLIFA